MSRFIEFTTTQDNIHMAVSRGNPIHNGELPTRYKEVQGVRVDGRSVDFSDPSIPDRLNRSLVNGKYLRPSDSFRCVAFVALMIGLDVRGPVEYDDDASFIVERDDEIQVGTKDRPNTPVDLAILLPGGMEYSYEHIMYPAHTADASLYLHKLGLGRVCLSGLQDALGMYSATDAHLVTSFEAIRQ